MREEAVPLRLVLLVTAFEGAENFGAAVSKGAEVVLEVVRSRRAALALLRRGQYAAIVVDAALSKTEVTQTEALWQNSRRRHSGRTVVVRFRWTSICACFVRKV